MDLSFIVCILSWFDPMQLRRKQPYQPFAVQADADRYAADIYRKITMVTSPHPKFIRTPLIVVLVRWFVRNALNILAERRRTTRNDCSVNGAT